MNYSNEIYISGLYLGPYYKKTSYDNSLYLQLSKSISSIDKR